MMANRPDYVFLQCAIERAGLVRVPINARSTAHELGVILADCEPKAIFYDQATAERVAGAECDGSGACRSTAMSRTTARATASCSAAPVDRAKLDRASLDDLSSINYTSGTSGRPKGVMLTHRNWAAVYRNMLVDRDIRGDDVQAHIGPLTHSSGTYFVPWFLRGATSVIVEGGTVDGLLAAIERHKVTVFTCVPTVLTRVVNHPDLDRFDLSSLRMIGYGAEPIPRNTLEKALAQVRTDPGQELRPDRSHDDGLHLAGVRAVQSRQRRAARRLHRPALYVRRGGAARTRRTVRSAQARSARSRSAPITSCAATGACRTRPRRCCATAGCGPATSPAWTTTG